MFEDIRRKLYAKKLPTGEKYLSIADAHTDVLFLQQYIGQNTKLGKITSMRIEEDTRKEAENQGNRLLLVITTNNSKETRYWLTMDYMTTVFANDVRKATTFVSKLTPYY